MAQVRFALHHKHKDGKYSIILWYRCEVGGIYKKLSGEHIHKRNWSTKTQRALPSTSGAFGLNRYLDELEEKVVNAVRQIRLSGARVSPDLLRSFLSGAAMKFWDYVELFLESPPEGVGEGTIKIYQRLFNNLRVLFPSMEFADINQSMVEAYIKHRQKQGVNDSTIRTELNKLRAICKHAQRAKITKTVPDLEFKITGVDDVGEIYLSDEEIKKLYGLLKSDKLEAFPHVADYIRFFVLGTQIGVRVSDLRINPEQIYEITLKDKTKMEVLDIIAEKTNEQVIIPLSTLAKTLLKHFKYRIPHFHDQKLNEYIKIAARIAGFIEPHIWREKINGKIVETVFEKWQLVSSHTMRRSFATNFYLRGAKPLTIMKITGHKKESTFLKYIRISKKEAAEDLGRFVD